MADLILWESEQCEEKWPFITLVVYTKKLVTQESKDFFWIHVMLMPEKVWNTETERGKTLSWKLSFIHPTYTEYYRVLGIIPGTGDPVNKNKDPAFMECVYVYRKINKPN